jgi:hypothetical protein
MLKGTAAHSRPLPFEKRDSRALNQRWPSVGIYAAKGQ